MADLAGWELLAGAAIVVWVLWRFGRFGRRSDKKLSGNEVKQSEPEEEQASNDWIGLLLPLVAVFLFVLFLINSLRS